MHELRVGQVEKMSEQNFNDWVQTRKCWKCENYVETGFVDNPYYCEGFNVYLMFIRSDDDECEHFKEVKSHE